MEKSIDEESPTGHGGESNMNNNNNSSSSSSSSSSSKNNNNINKNNNNNNNSNNESIRTSYYSFLEQSRASVKVEEEITTLSTIEGISDKNNNNHHNNSNNNNSDKKVWCCWWKYRTGSFCYDSNTFHSTVFFVLVMILLGFAASFAFIHTSIHAANQDEQLRFEKQSREIIKAMESAWTDYELTALWIHETCATESHTTTLDHLPYYCSREQFANLHHYIKSSGIKFQHIAYLPNITDSQRAQAEFEAKTYYAQHYPSLRYHGFIGLELQDNNTQTNYVFRSRSQQPFYFPYELIQPISGGNERFVGFDAYSSRESGMIDEAVETLHALVSNPFRSALFDDQNVIMLLHPGLPTLAVADGVDVGISQSKGRSAGLSSVLIGFSDWVERAIVGVVEPVSLHVFGTKSSVRKEDRKYQELGKVYLVPSDDHVETTYELTQGASTSTLPFLDDDDDDDSTLSKKTEVIELEFGQQTWILIVSAENGSFQKDSRSTFFTYFGGVAIGLACMAIACIAYVAAVKQTKMEKLRITNQAEKSALIAENAQKAVDAERQLNDYLAHEVRNPLAAALSACTFLQSTSSSYTSNTTTTTTTATQDHNMVQEDIEVIQSSLAFIDNLLRSTLDMHKMESKSLTLNLEPTDLQKDILDPVCAILRQQHRNNNHSSFRMIVECTPETIFLNTDRMRLKQIVMNLVSNSKKFVTRGYIRIRAWIEPKQDNQLQQNSTTTGAAVGAGAAENNTIMIAIEDSGPGIPEDKRQYLFQRVFHDSLQRVNSQGTGMGLCLCRKLVVELLKGSIYHDPTFDSGIPGFVGTRIVVNLNTQPIPVDKWHQQQQEQEEMQNSSFNQVSQTSSNSSRLVLRSNSRGEGHDTPTLSQTNASTVSSSPQVVNNQEGQPGTSTHMTSKEVDPESLLELESGLCPTIVSDTNKTLDTNSKSHLDSANVKDEGIKDHPSLPHDLSVLVVDDDLVIRKLLSRALRRVGPDWLIKEAANGETALCMVDNEEFDLILMDQYMASTEKQLLGTETVYAMRAKGVSSIICGLSANDTDQAFFDAGADCFHLKPLPAKQEELKAILIPILNSRC